MKKSLKKKLRLLFWVAFAAIGLTLALVPPGQGPKNTSVTVKVKQPEPEIQLDTPAPPPGGEEQTPAPTPAPLPAPQSSIMVPVTPEKPPEPTLPPGQRPKIALIIDDVGVDLKDSERAIQLPPAVTLSFLPYGARLRDQTREAREQGHELMLHMPMEPLGHEDPGPGALFVDLPMHDLQLRFEAALSSFAGFDGVNNHMGSKFTAYAPGMEMVVDELQQRHLFFLDSRTSGQSVGKSIALQKGLPTISRDVFLDDDQSPDMIRKQLESTEHTARRKGYAVAIGHPHAATLSILEIWIPEAQKRGVDFVAVNTLVK